MLFAPIEGWRHVKVTERRTAVDFAHVLKELSDVHFAKAEKIVLVQDNLNSHRAPAGRAFGGPPPYRADRTLPGRCRRELSICQRPEELPRVAGRLLWIGRYAEV